MLDPRILYGSSRPASSPFAEILLDEAQRQGKADFIHDMLDAARRSTALDRTKPRTENRSLQLTGDLASDCRELEQVGIRVSSHIVESGDIMGMAQLLADYPELLGRDWARLKRVSVVGRKCAPGFSPPDELAFLPERADVGRDDD